MVADLIDFYKNVDNFYKNVDKFYKVASFLTNMIFSNYIVLYFFDVYKITCFVVQIIDFYKNIDNFYNLVGKCYKAASG